jgi:xylulokinase
VLSIDLGTTRLKAALCSLSGELEGHVFTEIPIEHPESLRAEIDANRWWTGVTQLVPKLLQETGVDPDRIEAASLCGLMHALVPMSRSGEVLARSQLWMDQRCSTESASAN